MHRMPIIPIISKRGHGNGAVSAALALKILVTVSAGSYKNDKHYYNHASGSDPIKCAADILLIPWSSLIVKLYHAIPVCVNSFFRLKTFFVDKHKFSWLQRIKSVKSYIKINK